MMFLREQNARLLAQKGTSTATLSTQDKMEAAMEQEPVSPPPATLRSVDGTVHSKWIPDGSPLAELGNSYGQPGNVKGSEATPG